MRIEAYNRPHYTLTEEPSADSTLREMARVARESQTDLSLRRFAVQLVQPLAARDHLSEFAAVCYWIEDNIRYVHDPVEVEEIRTPRATLEDGAGDCDCMNVLLAALVGALGGHCRFVALAFRGRESEGYSHVVTEVRDPATGRWVVLDPVARENTTNMLQQVVARLVRNVF